MYEKVVKPKENKSRGVANSVSQKKSNEKQGFGFVDNRPEAIAQRKLQNQANSNFLNSQAISLNERPNYNTLSYKTAKSNSVTEEHNSSSYVKPLQRKNDVGMVSSQYVVQMMKEVIPGLYLDEDSGTYFDGEGTTYDGVADFQRRSNGKPVGLQVEEEILEPPSTYLAETQGPKYNDVPPLAWQLVPRRDVRAKSLSEAYYTVYRFADVNNPSSMYPYPGEQDAQIKMRKMQIESQTIFGYGNTPVSDQAAQKFARMAQLTVAYGRDNSPFIPVGRNFHTLANHKNRLMQEIVRTPAYFEMDPLRSEMPSPGKRAPHILRFEIPVEKEFLIYNTAAVDEQAASAEEMEIFGPLEPFLTGFVDNPY